MNKNNHEQNLSYRQQFYKIIKLIPVLNIIYDIFIDENYPSTDKLKYLLDSFGLISALILVAVSACVVTVNFDELIQADFRFSNDAIGAGKYYQYWNKYYTVPPSSELYNNVSSSIILLFLALGTIIYVNIDLLSKKNPEEEKERKYVILNNGNDENRDAISGLSYPDIDKPEEEEKVIIKRDSPYNRWWRFTKWNFLIIFACITGGCFFSFYTFVVLLSIKYPDYYVNNHGDATNTTDSPYGRNSSICFIATVAVMGFVVISSGIGTAFYHLQLDEDEEDARYQAEVERIERKRLRAEKLREEKLREMENAMATLDSLALSNGDDELVVGGRLEESKLINKSSRKKPSMIHNAPQPLYCANCNQAGNSYVLPFDED